MADPTPNPPAGVPPKPAEAAKVQPKKETVRINLPPKPTAAPTIKIPTPGTGGVAAPTPSIAATPAAPAAAITTAPAAPLAAPRPVAAAVPAPPARPTPASRPAPMMVGVSGVDKVLAIVAAVIGLVVVIRLFLLGS